MVYVPNYNNSKCVVVRDSQTLRVYQQRPTNNSTIDYVDYYVNSHYMYSLGVQQFSSYTTLPTCMNNDEITTNFYYRNDFDSIMIIFLSILLLAYFFAFKPISRLFGRWLKL